MADAPKEGIRLGRRSTTTSQKWRIDGRTHRAHDRLREAVREAEGREADPCADVIVSQVVKTTLARGL